MGSFSIWHWLIVLAIVVLVFGTKRLRGAGSDLGSAVKNFKSAMSQGEAEVQDPANTVTIQTPPAAPVPETKPQDHV